MSDILIAQSTKLKNITTIAKEVGLTQNDLELYGKYKAKIEYETLDRLLATEKTETGEVISKNKDGKLILVTAITPGKSGEGKTTVTIGVGDALKRLGKKTVIALREPSLGPVFGVKGGATGGGYSQVAPMEDINLHFTGDFHAIESANNLLAAMLDNHIQQGNELKIDTRKIYWKRCVDMNDRALRNVVIGMGGTANGVPREDHYTITVASEIMAIFCLSNSLSDLRDRLGKIVVAETFDGKPVTANDLRAVGAMMALLKDAFKPNLVQTLEGTPTIIHGGPFANIAHGCNSVMATKTALKLGDYVVTEAGFGADLGAEKFLDIKCRQANISPSAIVLVVTTKAYEKDNLIKHIRNLEQYNIPIVVALNRFTNDSEYDIDTIRATCKLCGYDLYVSNAWAKGGEGAIDLANAVIKACDKSSNLNFAYNDSDSIKQKIETLAKKIYGADRVNFSSKALKSITTLESWGYGKYLICVAKTQYSISDKAELGKTPVNYTLDVKDVYVSAGAGFVVVLTGDIMTMPGLPKVPAAENIGVSDNGVIYGIF